MAAGALARRRRRRLRYRCSWVQQNNQLWPTVLSAVTKGYNKVAPGSSSRTTTSRSRPSTRRSSSRRARTLCRCSTTRLRSTWLRRWTRAARCSTSAQEFQKLGVSNELVPAATAILKKLYGGKVVALPLEFNIEGVWYNKKIFAANGIAVPKTWDQLVAAAAKLQAAGIQPFAASGIQGWPITRLIGNYIFRTLGPNAMQNVHDGKAKLTDPEYVAAAQEVAELGAAGYFGKGVGSLDYNAGRGPVPQRQGRDVLHG